MTEWVRTDDLAALIERNWSGSKSALARETGEHDRAVRKILNRQTKVTMFWVADRFLTRMGLSPVDLEVISVTPRPHDLRRKERELHRKANRGVSSVPEVDGTDRRARVSARPHEHGSGDHHADQGPRGAESDSVRPG
jgi:hypothetical protein